MNVNTQRAGNRDAALENFAAQLTAAAYPIALRAGVGDRWLDLELDLWRAMTETVKQQGRDLHPC